MIKLLKIFTAMVIAVGLNFCSFAFEPIILKYQKTIISNNGIWGDVNIPFQMHNGHSAPRFSLEKVGHQQFRIEFSDMDFRPIVTYSPGETERMRKLYIDNDYHAYKYEETNDYILTYGFTLDQLLAQPKIWTEAKNEIRIHNIMYTENIMHIYSAYQKPMSSEPRKARCAIYNKATSSDEYISLAESIDWMDAPEDAFIEILESKNPNLIKLRYFEKGRFIKTYDLKLVGTDAPSHDKSDQHNEVYTIVNVKDSRIVFYNMKLANIFDDRKAWNNMEHAFILINDQPKTQKYLYIK